MKIKLDNWQTGKTVKLQHLEGASFTSVQRMQDVYHSAGSINGGGTITDNGDGTYSVTAGHGYIRPTDSDTDTLYAFDFPAGGPFTPTTGAITYVGVEYNSGNPQIVQRSTRNWNFQTDFPLGQVVEDGGVIHVFNAPQGVGDHAGRMIEAMKDTMGIARDSYNGGVIIGSSNDGNRYMTLTAGSFWFGLNQFQITAKNTGTGDVFDGYYRNGSGGWSSNTGLTQWNNTQYDNNSGTLQTLGVAKYAVNWFYIDVEDNGSLVMVYPQNQHNTLAEAQAASPPSSVPPRIQSHGKLVGRLIFQNGATNRTQIDSAFTASFSSSEANNHNNLSGLQGGTAGEYYHLTAARHTDLTDGGDSTLHFHATDRARANHTGTQTASTISDFDTEVSNNTDVSANTSARHSAVTLTGTPDYLTLSGQEITLGQIDLTTDVTGLLPSSNIADAFVLNTGDTMTGNLLNTAHIGVGSGLASVNPNFIFEANETFTNTSGERRGLSFFAGSAPTSSSSASILGFVGFAEHTVAQPLTGSLFGAFFGSRNSNSNTVSVMYGGFSEVQGTSTGTIGFAVGMIGSINQSGAGTTSFSYGLQSSASVGSGGTISEFHGVQVSNPSGAGTVTNNYGIYLEGQTKGSTNYGIYGNAGLWSLGDDIIFRNNSDGVILVDRTTATNYRLYVDSGSLQIESV